MIDGYTRYDLRRTSFEDFIAFLFAKEVPPMGEDGVRGNPWYWSAIVEFEPLRVVCDYTRLFAYPRFLLEQYSREQLEQGFTAIHGPSLEVGLASLLWERQVPFAIRENCVRSMYSLFAKLFAEDGLDSASEMWWDSIAYDWDGGNRSRANGGEDKAMQDVMFETLSKILALPQAQCQFAALHGLGHLHHPETLDLIGNYLARNPDISEELKEYALDAARFDVM